MNPQDIYTFVGHDYSILYSFYLQSLQYTIIYHVYSFIFILTIQTHITFILQTIMTMYIYTYDFLFRYVYIYVYMYMYMTSTVGPFPFRLASGMTPPAESHERETCHVN